MLAFQQFDVGCHIVNIAVKLVRGFHFHSYQVNNSINNCQLYFLKYVSSIPTRTVVSKYQTMLITTLRQLFGLELRIYIFQDYHVQRRFVQDCLDKAQERGSCGRTSTHNYVQEKYPPHSGEGDLLLSHNVLK